MKKICIYLLLIASFSACTGYISEPDSSSGGSNNAGVTQLVHEADALNRQGQHARAKEKLERALRLEKNNPYIWLALAKTHQMEGNLGQAKNLALRAKSLSTNAQLTRNIDNFIAGL